MIDNDITSDNIKHYYKFMSQEDKRYYQYLLHSLFSQRREEIGDSLGVCFVDDARHIKEEAIGDYLVGQSFFGVQDTLEPLEDYSKKLELSRKNAEHAKMDSVEIAHQEEECPKCGTVMTPLK